MLSTIIILVVLGIVTIGLEFFLPGGVLGVLGVLVIASAVGLCFKEYGPAEGLIAATVAIICTVGTLTFGLKNFQRFPGSKKLLLQAEVKKDETHLANQHYLHQEGIAQTDLRPAGKALIDQHRLDVVAESDLIPAGATVKIIAVEGNRIVVRRTLVETSQEDTVTPV